MTVAAPPLPAPTDSPAPAPTPTSASPAAVALAMATAVPLPPPATPVALPAHAAVAVAGPKLSVASDPAARTAGPATPAASGTEVPATTTELTRAIAPLLAADARVAADSPDASPDAMRLAGAALPATLAPGPAPTPQSTQPSAGGTGGVAQVSTPVGSPDWGQHLGDRVALLVNQNFTSAQIKLSPAHLGPLEISIAVSDGQTNVAFTAHSQVTREALEAAAPTLRAALNSHGFGNVNVDVSQQQFRDRAAQNSQYEPEFSFGAQAAQPVGATGAASAVRSAGLSRLDAYA